jgi:hypothetical protein
VGTIKGWGADSVLSGVTVHACHLVAFKQAGLSAVRDMRRTVVRAAGGWEAE